MSERWEYKVVYFSYDRWRRIGLPSEFDTYGAEGWELVGTEAIIQPSIWTFGSKTVGIVGFFKRQVVG